MIDVKFYSNRMNYLSEKSLYCCINLLPHFDQLMRWIIAAITALSKSCGHLETDSSCTVLKAKASKEQRDTKDSKTDKGKKENEGCTDDMSGWKPWHHIWPKDPNSRYPLAPLYNPGGKYCLKIFWMVSGSLLQKLLFRCFLCFLPNAITANSFETFALFCVFSESQHPLDLVLGRSTDNHTGKSKELLESRGSGL